MEKSYRELCGEIEALKQQAEAARKRESASALAEVKRLIAEFRFSAAECGFSSVENRKAARKEVVVKFRHPNNPSLTWTGRGKAPKWLSEEEAQGRRREAFLVR